MPSAVPTVAPPRDPAAVRPPAPLGEGRILALDGLRGLAALAVVVYHYTTRYPEIDGPREGMWFSFSFGQYGVRLFFIISGFVIFMTVDRSKNLWQFIASRFARLFPVFWVCVGLTYAMLVWTNLPHRQVSTTDALWNLTMVPAMMDAKSVDGAYWSLRYELSFYIVMGLILGLGLRRYALFIMAGIVVLAATGQRQVSVRLYGEAGTLPLWDFHPYWCSMFLIGMTLYDMRSRVRWWHVGLLLLCFAEICVQQWAWRVPDATHPRWPYLVVIAFSTLAVFVASRWHVPLLTSRPIVFLGTISYSWYLIHQNVGYAIIHWTESMGGHVMLGVGVAFVACVAIAFGLTKLVEQPANRWLRRALTPRSRNTQTAPPPISPPRS